MVIRKAIPVLNCVVWSFLFSAVASAQVPSPGPTTPPASSQSAATPPPTPVIFQEAVLRAANELLSKVAAGSTEKRDVVIDPLVDGATGQQLAATKAIGQRIAELVRTSYPRFEIKPFNAENVAKSPLILIGTFTPINQAGQTEGPRDAYRVWLTLADLKTNAIVSKAQSRAKLEGVDASPTIYFRDSPVWSSDAATDGYIKSCQGGTKVGDPLSKDYSDRILAATLISDAVAAYDARQYEEALELFQSALRTPGGDQLRAHNGIYLANWKLNRRDAASEAFGRLIDYGLATNRVAVKFLFRPGRTQFVADRNVSEAYPLWLTQLAQRTSTTSACLEVVGHASKTGPEPVNMRLSTLRARRIKERIEVREAVLGRRLQASGVGSKEALIGTGKDDVSDALDRRVEFKVVSCKSAADRAPRQREASVVLE